MASRRTGRDVFLGANSSRPTGSLRQRPKTQEAGEREFAVDQDKENKQNP